MHIVHIASELSPIARVGGLGDVVHGLSRALVKKDHLVNIIVPKYASISPHDIRDFREVNSLEIPTNSSGIEPKIWIGKVDSVETLLVDVDPLFSRENIYGYADDALRFALFCVIAVSLVCNYLKKVDIVHLHDWQTGLCASLFEQARSDLPIHCVFTIHNLTYQGICDQDVMDACQVANDIQLNILDPVEANKYNLLKAGIQYSDRITTVSPRYAEEILNTDEGGPLRALLVKNQNRFSGILNGIDNDYWNPETDHYLTHHYSINDLKNRTPPFIEAKQKIKQELQKAFSLELSSAPLLSIVTRLVWQKGPELIAEAVDVIPKLGGQLILLGTLLDPDIERDFITLESKFKNHPSVHIELSFDEKLSHLLFAGSDLLIIPSRFEPCGLTQMIAMRYGTVPLVRETGGLANTVFEGQNGFVFNGYSKKDFQQALERTFYCWHQHPEKWFKLIETGMHSDFSWNKSVEKYLLLYSDLLKSDIII